MTHCPYCGVAAKPHSAYCAACGQLLSAIPAVVEAIPASEAPSAPAVEPSAPAVAAGRPARLALPDGTRLDLAGQIVLGRRPDGAGAFDGHTAIALIDPQKLVSRAHVAIDARGARVTIVDLGSANGTTLVRAGAASRLSPRLPVILEPGDRLEVGSLEILVEA